MKKKTLKTKDKFMKKKLSFEKEAGIDFKKLEKWIIKNWGKKCKDFLATCSVCQIWRIYEDLKDFLEF